MEGKKVKLLSVLFSTIFLIMSISSVYASLDGQASLIIDSDNLDSILFDDAYVKAELSTGEVVESSTNSDGEFSLDFDSVYCWENCNIYPDIIIGSLKISKEDITTVFNPNLKNEDELPFTFIRIFEEKTETIGNSNPTYTTINNNIILDEKIESDYGYLVEWNGTLLLQDSGTYELMFDVSQGILIFNGVEYNLNRDETIHVNASEENEVYLKYVTDNDIKPNMYILDGGELELVSSDDLLFINGGSKKIESISSFRMATSSLPQPDLTVHPSYQLWRYNNFNLNNEPVLLVHGLHGSEGYVFDDFSSFDYWYDNTAERLPKYLQSENHEPYMLVYVPANLSTRVYSVILKDSLQIVKSQHGVTKVDVVTHSMGGLLVRSYMNNLGINPITGNSVSYGSEIDKVVFLGTPNHGSYLANRVINGEAPFCAALTGMLPEDPDAEAYEELSVGSLYQWELNNIPITNPQNYLVISGVEDIACLPDDITGSADINHAFDGFVSLPSASLLEQNVPLISMKLNHASIKGGEHTPWYWTDYTHDMSDDVGPIIIDFLEHIGTQTQLRNKITPDLETGEYAIFPGISSNPYETGMVFVKADVNEVRLKNSAGTFYDLTEWEGNVWYWFGSTGLAIPTGIYSIYADGVNTGEMLEIFGAQTTLKESSFSDLNTQKADFVAKISIIPQATCAKYNYWIESGQFSNLPSGLTFDITYPINTSHVRVKDVDGKSIDMFTEDECVSCGVVSVCQTIAGFSSVLYNGQSINQGSCATTSSQTQICWDDLDRVMLIRTLNTTPSCITPTNNMQINSNTKLCNGQYNLPNGLQIISGNIMLDCNGAKLVGNTNGKSFVSGSRGLWIQQPNVTIQNCEIRNYSHGIESSSNNIISSNILNSTFYWNFRGISLTNKHNVQFNNFYNNVVGVDVSVSGTTADVSWNEFYSNSFNLVNGLDGDVNAINNWWGTNNQIEISQSITDSNDISGRGTVNFVPYIEKISLCTPLIQNTSQSEWQNTSCLINDKVGQTRFSIQYDVNNCGTFSNQTISEYREIDSCDYCQPISTNTTFTDWQNQTSCLLGDYYIQNQSKTEYDSNFSSCYLITNLTSDLWNNGVNKTYFEFRNQSCDFCTPNITNTSWSEWSNLGICTIADIQNQSRFKVQYDSKQCQDHNIQNQTIIEYKTTPCDYCNYSIKTISTDWQNDSCLITDSMKQRRTNVTFDTNYSSCYSITHLQNDLWNNGQNITIQEFKELGQNSCNYCSENISQPQYTQWSGCLNGVKSHIKYYTDSNYASCCAVTSLGSDCSINTYQNVTETSTDGCSNQTNQTNSTNGSLLLISPTEGIYSERGVMFNLSSVDKFTKLVYSDNNGRESSLCTNCNGYARKKTLSDGNHVLLFRGMLPDGKNVTNQTELFIDSKDPQISTIKPQSRKYTNGSDFYIKYTEDNLQNVTLFYGSDKTEKDSCEDGRNKNCTFNINLSKYDNQSIAYSFRLVDIAGNIDQSRNTTIKVDTTSPEIKDFTAPIVGRYVYFNMSILNEDKNSFNKIEYQDNSGRWNSLCTSLKNNNCYKKVSFKTGNHNVIVRVTDDAGNSDTEIININIL